MSKTVNLGALVDKIRQNGTITLELDDGKDPILVPPLALWPEDANKDADGVRIILGDDQADRYFAAGGTADLLVAVALEGQRADAGESEASTDS